MHLTLLQSLFEHLFYAISDLIFLGLNIYMASLVSRGGMRVHLNWIAPFIVECSLVLVYRGTITAHYFFGVHISPGLYLLRESCLYTANVIGIIGNVILCRALKTMVSSIGETRTQPALNDEGVWPPAPQEKH